MDLHFAPLVLSIKYMTSISCFGVILLIWSSFGLSVGGPGYTE